MMPAMTLNDLETPALVLDVDKTDRNIARLRARLAALGVQARPHLKTGKSIDVARHMLDSLDAPAAVSTLKEAEQFAAAGLRDLLYAVGLAPNKFDHVQRLRASGVDLSVVVDNLQAARLLAAHARASGDRVPVLIEIDSDGHRCGAKPASDELLKIAEHLAGDCDLRGVMTHAGASYGCFDDDAKVAMAEQERAAAVDSAKALRAAGHAAPVVSVGSTPTAHFARSLDGVTEVRAGVYVFSDLVMAGLGVGGVNDIALSVLASVIGHQRDKGWIVVDAGWMAMSRDRGTSTHPVDQGYGLVCDVAGEPIGDLIMIGANQEHGILAVRPGAAAPLPELPIGALLRILPNHACATAAQFDRYHVVQGGDEVLAQWPRFSGW
jgi:D-serine deaminase-like pyridoxal phosphate-dependent protein